ncbi:unnamed protein product [Prunus armeniaca]|uniref:Bifunctional inhibitor/plant lipid transfer protein/seed storage helical domain-containing protein n=1 Tax=Prunus armeniaca TaxID=36596 RepID=A0A6J5TCA7_PRUAR|nr:hypothetical protein GBA52_005586 [Prunus armeniaca]CAB4261543.1 unnamed protein product [Prunus armeniaca]
MITTTTALHRWLMAFVLAWTLVVLSAAAAEPPPQPGCADELVRFSPCLPYVSSPPNNRSDSAPPKCCDALSSSFESGGALCLCYLIQDPPMLGFPVNETRVLSLSSTCPLSNNGTSTKSTDNSLESLCSGSPELPPLRSSTISGISSPSPSPSPSGADNASSPLMSLPSESTNSSSLLPGKRSPTTPPSSAVEPAGVSTAMKQICRSNTWFLPAVLIFLVPISTHL